MTRMFLLLCVLLTAACSATPGNAGPAGLLAEVRQTGGLCPEGRCDDRFTVLTDGSWERRKQERLTASGRLTQAELDALRRAVAATGLPSSSPKDSSGCAAAADGQEVEYTIGTVTVSSCRNALPAGDPLPEMLDALRARSD
jgi:hypothetical protein